MLGLGRLLTILSALSATGLGDLIEGAGEPAALLRACTSRKAATEILCAASEVTLSSRGRRSGWGCTREVVELLLEVGKPEGEEGWTCLNERRLKESTSVVDTWGLAGLLGGGTGGTGGGEVVPEEFFCQKKNEPDFLEEVETSLGRADGCSGSERVDDAPPLVS